MSNNRRKVTCSHNVYIKGLCGNCGIQLDPPQSTSVSMIHSVPELKVSEDYAKEIGKADQERLIQERKLVLLVDLDQTILHTTHERVRNHPEVHSFELQPRHPTYHTKLRPHLKEFLERMSKIYELHIFTFGCRKYAHKIASIIDPTQKYFGNRILSRDESVDQYSKKGNLNNLFPCGDAMVCIIDDRADVWRDAGNLIQVKPYSYFKTSISDGAMMKANNSSTQSAEEDATLDADADMLEALIGGNTNDDNDSQGDKLATTSSETTGNNRSGSGDDDRGTDSDNTKPPSPTTGSGDVGADSPKIDEEEAESTSSSESSSEGGEESSGGGGDQMMDAVEKSDKAEPSSSIDEDHDDYLLHLPDILSRIHEKWYMELDEQRQFLVDGENYKLPDIKDIIKRYLTKRYH
uniref:RNA polymerase II subunit A C-terminal domain phosphatase n=1 Tax=Aceria tosichella TaxID=561515 RepID=A0A6G1S690_9ACAR